LWLSLYFTNSSPHVKQSTVLDLLREYEFFFHHSFLHIAPQNFCVS